MYFGNIKNCDIANGIGIRVSLFVSGCRNRCPDCFNAMTWDFKYGQEYTNETKEKILKMLEPSYIDGFALLGGEPFEEEKQKELSELLLEIKKKFPTKDIWCYTGYVLEKDLFEGGRKYTQYTKDMLSCIDVLVDGPFIKEKKNLMLKFRGSENQRVLKLQETLKENKPIYYFENDKQ